MYYRVDSNSVFIDFNYFAIEKSLSNRECPSRFRTETRNFGVDAGRAAELHPRPVAGGQYQSQLGWGGNIEFDQFIKCEPT